MMVVDHPEEGDVTYCKSCTEETGLKLVFYVPDDLDNYPVECERCGGVMTEPGVWIPKEDR